MTKIPGWFSAVLLSISGFFLAATFFNVVDINSKVNQLLINEAARDEKIRNLESRMTTLETRLEKHLQINSNEQ